jgi:hypothetical protein
MLEGIVVKPPAAPSTKYRMVPDIVVRNSTISRNRSILRLLPSRIFFNNLQTICKNIRI